MKDPVSLLRFVVTLPKRQRRFWRLPRHRRAMVIETFAALAVARVWLLTRPFPSVARKLGAAVAPDHSDHPPIPILDEPDAAIAREISAMVRWVARFVPFRAVCIQRAVAAKMMLGRRGIPSIMHFGVARSASGGRIVLKAHAWLEAPPVEVTGLDEAPEYQEIARFV